mmetsp:Transcript_2272/g.3157  ORF Transcript_2272/g.3157 Transcript_2272/m.3157 type:complete len:150 (-) Transcript_2272:268-717(-)|eukprot:CAMPEP_0117759288 /NCGR_PEP_ID=MMETSP0947-20121206/15927_1 /TAXON_ID=44440 /ORGANISM="Chattonella subsalsa, Strain CCMP2191" /LENGTH=149 /DNA_ID=CAMNT_0005579723 /DNA_START=72 /DNA_END=521 /DNA_ORIENTATION=-
MDVDDEESSKNLNFGPDFGDKLQCLTNAEVAVVLTSSKELYESKDLPLNPLFQKTLEYVKRHSNFTEIAETTAKSTELRQSLELFEFELEGATKSKLHQFEISALVNLMQGDSEVEEALSLVPSLARFQEDNLEEILEVVKRHASKMYA